MNSFQDQHVVFARQNFFLHGQLSLSALFLISFHFLPHFPSGKDIGEFLFETELLLTFSGLFFRALLDALFFH